MEETRETVTDFLDLGTKVTADGDCSHEIKSRLLLGRKATTNLDSILESRDINLPTNVCLVKAIVFLWSCMDVSWIIKRRKVAQSYATLWSHGQWPTRFLWGKSTGVNRISFSRGSSGLGDQTQVSCIAGRCFNVWATRKAQRKLSTKDLMLFNCSVGDDSWESLRLQD